MGMPLVGVGFVEVAGTVDEVGSGGMPKFCSVQYEFPLTSLHEDPTDGFCGRVRLFMALVEILHSRKSGTGPR